MAGKLTVALALLRVLLPEPVQRLLYAGRLPEVEGRRIDASARAVSDLVAAVRDPNTMPTLEQSRAQIAAMAAKFDQPCPASVEKTDIHLPGAEGDRPARVYTPRGQDGDSLPTLLYLHGGGWVQGGIATHDGICGKLADWAGIRVISFDYRLAPEHRFPAAPDDVLACYRALVSGQTPLKIDPARLAVGGDSAGANLTAALMHDLGAAGEARPAAQLLIYPAVDARMTSASMQALKDQPVLPLPRIRWYLDLYLPKDQDRLAPRVSPLLSPHLAGQPPALIIPAGHDPLWNDGIGYAEALRAAGVRVDLAPFPGQVHAFISLTKVIPQGNAAIRQAADWLAKVVR